MQQLLIFLLFAAELKGFTGFEGEVSEVFESEFSCFETGSVSAVERCITFFSPGFIGYIGQQFMCGDKRMGEGIHGCDMGNEQIFDVG